jgi:hypothetical protein
MEFGESAVGRGSEFADELVVFDAFRRRPIGTCVDRSARLFHRPAVDRERGVDQRLGVRRGESRVVPYRAGGRFCGRVAGAEVGANLVCAFDSERDVADLRS